MGDRLVLQHSALVLLWLYLTKPQHALMYYLREPFPLLQAYLFEYLWSHILPITRSLFLLCNLARPVNLETPFDVPQDPLALEELHIFHLLWTQLLLVLLQLVVYLLLWVVFRSSTFLEEVGFSDLHKLRLRININEGA